MVVLPQLLPRSLPLLLIPLADSGELRLLPNLLQIPLVEWVGDLAVVSEPQLPLQLPRHQLIMLLLIPLVEWVDLAVLVVLLLPRLVGAWVASVPQLLLVE